MTAKGGFGDDVELIFAVNKMVAPRSSATTAPLRRPAASSDTPRNIDSATVSKSRKVPSMLLSLQRALRVSAAIAGWLFFNAAWLYLVFLVETPEISSGGERLQTALACLFLAGNIVIPAALLLYRRRRRSVWIAQEAERWLANLQRRPIAKIAQRSRRIRRLFWIPSALALGVLLFFPETMGIVSHLRRGRSFTLNGHTLRTPVTSLIWGREKVFLSILVGRGIARAGLKPYLRGDPPLSSLYFYAADPDTRRLDELYLARAEVSVDRTLNFDGEILTCLRVTPKGRPVDPDLLHILCHSSRNDLKAEFYGLPMDASVFYGMLQRAD
jgi:hypothetical protein